MSEQQLDTVAYAAATPDLEQPWKEPVSYTHLRAHET